jgi:hypothetical protein
MSINYVCGLCIGKRQGFGLGKNGKVRLSTPTHSSVLPPCVLVIDSVYGKDHQELANDLICAWTNCVITPCSLPKKHWNGLSGAHVKLGYSIVHEM